MVSNGEFSLFTRFLLAVGCLVKPSAAGKLWANVCTQDDTKTMAFCDKTKPIDERVKDYVARVPDEVKPGMMQNSAAALDALHIPPYQWGSEGLHGPLEPCVCEADNKTCKCPTSFPCPSALGGAFNVSLYRMIGEADGLEARALNNLRNHATQNVYGDGIDYWSPTINLQRDPRWGRNQEVPGEDPMLTGAYATAFVSGLQSLDDGGGAQVVACCKHFVANSLENWQGITRHNFDAPVSAEDLAEYYLPPFRACVMEGHSLGIMCSYNEVNGVPSCANDWLLQQTLRESWRFEGYVTSDCGAIRDECVVEPDGHGYTGDNCANATALSIKAGTDVDCGGVYKQGIPDAIKAGLLTQDEVDVSFARLTTIQMRLGLFDDGKASDKYFTLGSEAIDSPAHQQLALEAAQQSIVLLKNEGQLLPLQPGQTLAVIGPHFNATEVLLSNYHGSRCVDAKSGPGTGNDFSCIPSVLNSIVAANEGGATSGLMGCSIAGTSGNDIAAAVALAKKADVVVLAMGIDQSQEAEGRDRINTTLPGEQAALVQAIAALGKPTVMVLLNGGTLSLGPLKGAVPAILAASYGGEMGALALADVLFGRYNPSAKLAATWYPPDFVSQLPLTEMSLTAPPGRTHMFYSGEAEFVFGAGLSYSEWALEWHAAPPTTWPIAEHEEHIAPVAFRVRVRNVGSRAGRQTILVFVRSADSDEARGPRAMRQKLVAFDGVAPLAPGADGLISFSLQPSDVLGRADHEGKIRVTRGAAFELVARDGVNELVHAFVSA